MDSKRLILFMVFVVSVFVLVEGWQRDGQGRVAPAASSAPPTASSPSSAPVAPASSSVAALPAGAEALQKGETVRVETDLFVADIDTAGGDLRRLELLTHKDTIDTNKNFTLLQQGPEHVYVAQSGLIGANLPNHRTPYSATEALAKLAAGKDSVSVRLSATTPEGVKVTKVYTFHRGSYVVDVGFEIENKTASVLQPDAYFQLVRDSVPPAGDSAMLPTYTGMAVYTDKQKFEKVSFKDADNGKAYPKKSDDGWIAFLQHYFLAAWLPRSGLAREFYIKHLDNGLYAAGVIQSLGRIEPGAQGTLTVSLYAGPEEQDKLAALAPGLDLTIDYGVLTVIAKPLFWVLKWLHAWVGNWGVAIIILTMIIKAIFYPLSAASYRSMARMRVMAPRIQKLKEQYGSDRQKLNQSMMELYKTEKINPLGGCLPVVVQIPVFIALYWVILASVELRHTPLFLWVHDLSVPDPYYILPLLMGATMILQTSLNPEPPDPVQAKIMKIMPVAFSIMFFFFPAGLVLYWLVNNVLSIAQQWHINRAMKDTKPAPHAR